MDLIKQISLTMQYGLTILSREEEKERGIEEVRERLEKALS